MRDSVPAIRGRTPTLDLELDGQRYGLRTDLAGSAFEAFAAAGVRLPAAVTYTSARRRHRQPRPRSRISKCRATVYLETRNHFTVRGFRKLTVEAQP